MAGSERLFGAIRYASIPIAWPLRKPAPCFQQHRGASRPSGRAGLRVALDIFPLHALPLYNEDDDAGHAPESVRALRSAIASDGVIMISPEYNHGMSGVLKNALDWASRPYGLSVLKSKPVLTMTASPALIGGVRAQQQMNETLASIPARPVFRPQIVIGGVHGKVRDGRLIDEAALSFALSGADDLIEEIRAVRSV
jgi:chromate reductase, NAD(P)H dehydrogenase (quinone)